MLRTTACTYVHDRHDYSILSRLEPVSPSYIYNDCVFLLDYLCRRYIGGEYVIFHNLSRDGCVNIYPNGTAVSVFDNKYLEYENTFNRPISYLLGIALAATLDQSDGKIP